MPERAELSEEIYRETLKDAVIRYPEECCGLLFGSVSEDGSARITQSVSMRNRVLPGHRGSHYGIDPLELFRKEQLFEKKGLELIGFYHSHPNAAAEPSAEDKGDMIPGFIYMIVSLMSEKKPVIRAWVKNTEGDRNIESCDIRDPEIFF